MRKTIIILLFFVLGIQPLFAQTSQQSSGWLFLLNSTKFNEKWGLHFDLQLRSADEFNYLRNVLIRPGLTYYINKNNNVTLGYLLNTTKIETSGVGDINLLEHRIWEQYILTHKINSVFASHRFRLEQRFIGQAVGDDIFSQRFRYFFRLIQPLQAKQETFTKGAFVALQNEVFLNIQNKNQLNKSIFDQNRAYLAAGYRFSKKVDVEVGYLNQFSNGLNSSTMNNVVQLALYTRF